MDQTPELHVARIFPVNPEEQTGAHVPPDKVGATQFPIIPFGTSGFPKQGFPEELAQTPDTDHAPTEHVAEGFPENPELQAMAHVTPSKLSAMQFPLVPSAIVGTPEHRERQAPVVVQAPESHVAERVPVNPELQTGVQVVPEAELT